MVAVGKNRPNIFGAIAQDPTPAGRHPTPGSKMGEALRWGNLVVGMGTGPGAAVEEGLGVGANVQRGKGGKAKDPPKQVRPPVVKHGRYRKNIKDVPMGSKEWHKFSLQEQYNDPRRIKRQNEINKKHLHSVANQPKLNELLHDLKKAVNQGNDKLVKHLRKEIKRWTV